MTLSERLEMFAERSDEVVAILPQMVDDIFNGSLANYAEFLQLQQLSAYQVDADGASMPPYTPGTMRRYHKPCSNYNLFVKGDLYGSITAVSEGGRIHISANTPYSSLYEYAYGLTADSIQKLRDRIMPELLSRVYNYLTT